MKKEIKLTEDKLKSIIFKEVKKRLNEVNMNFGPNSGAEEEMGDNGPSSIGEDYYAFAQRLEHLTGTEWAMTNKRISDNFNQNDTVITFATRITEGSQAEKLEYCPEIAKMFANFLGGDEFDEESIDYDMADMEMRVESNRKLGTAIIVSIAENVTTGNGLRDDSKQRQMPLGFKPNAGKQRTMDYYDTKDEFGEY